MAKPLFRVTEPLVLGQYRLIRAVVRKHQDVCVIAYQSNWYVIIACLDRTAAAIVGRALANASTWEIERRPGRKFPDRIYLQIRFNR